MSAENTQEPADQSRLRKVVPDREWEPAYWETSQNPDISFKALGVHTYLMSKPKDWEISAERIAHERKEGRAAIQAAMRELKAANLMRTMRIQEKGGKWSTVTTIYAKSSLCPQDEAETQEEDTKPQVGPKIGYRASVDRASVDRASVDRASVDRASVDRASENRSLKKKEPTRKNHINNSSSVVTVEDHAHEERSKEEEKSSTKKNHKDFPLELKTYVAALEYYGKKPTPEQYRQIAALVEPLLAAGADAGELKRQLQADTGRGVHSIVGLYLSKLKKMRPEDLKPSQKAPTSPRVALPKWETQTEEKIAQHRFEAPWCGECDEKTRIQEVATGFMGTRKRLCPTCGSKKPATVNA